MQHENSNIETLLADDLRSIKSRIDEVLEIYDLIPSLAAGVEPKTAASAFAMDDEADAASLGQDGNIEHLDPTQVQAAKSPARSSRQSLPHPRLIRQIIHNRQLRQRYFGADLFADPAWDMLLDLSATEAENRRVCVSSLCIASNVPQSTALRWIDMLAAAGLVARQRDSADARRIFVMLTASGTMAVAKYFADLGAAAEFAL